MCTRVTFLLQSPFKFPSKSPDMGFGRKLCSRFGRKLDLEVLGLEGNWVLLSFKYIYIIFTLISLNIFSFVFLLLYIVSMNLDNFFFFFKIFLLYKIFNFQFSALKIFFRSKKFGLEKFVFHAISFSNWFL